MSYNVPDDWGQYFRRCSECGEQYHASEGPCCPPYDEPELPPMKDGIRPCHGCGAMPKEDQASFIGEVVIFCERDADFETGAYVASSYEEWNDQQRGYYEQD